MSPVFLPDNPYEPYEPDKTEAGPWVSPNWECGIPKSDASTVNAITRLVDPATTRVRKPSESPNSTPEYASACISSLLSPPNLIGPPSEEQGKSDRSMRRRLRGSLFCPEVLLPAKHSAPVTETAATRYIEQCDFYYSIFL